MATRIAPISIKQFLVTISGQTFQFSSIKGGKEDSQEDTYVDPTTGTEYKTHSFTKRDNITLGKLFDPAADKALITWAKTTKDKNTLFNVSVQPVDQSLAGTQIASSGTFLYNNCSIKSYTYPEADRDGTGYAKMEIEMSYESVTYS